MFFFLIQLQHKPTLGMLKLVYAEFVLNLLFYLGFSC